MEGIANKIFQISNSDEFQKLALKIFRFQSEKNSLYNLYIKELKMEIASINNVKDIPFLPVEFFKTHQVFSGEFVPERFFSSSGTTGQKTSSHYISDIRIYEQSFLQCFNIFYGKPSDYFFYCLLPSYLEREGSSLVYMTKKLIELSGHKESGFFLSNTDELYASILKSEEKNQKAILLGVSYALLDFAEKYPMKLQHTLVMETGGMKGREKEITRHEMYDFLKQNLGIAAVHSEYGMTELLSQAYSSADGTYQTPPWMKVFIRDLNDPLTLIGKGKTGGINIIDLANIHSCSFIETKDLGRINRDGTFEVSGRFDNSDIRGCSLMVS